MARWDDPRGPRHDHDRDRWRSESRGGEQQRGERRSFGEDGRGHDQNRSGPRGNAPREAWRGDRNAARYDQDRIGYGWREDDAANRAYARRQEDRGRQDLGPTHGGEPYAYGGQEYGIETHGGFGGGGRQGPGWGFDRDSERRRNFDLDDPGAGQSPAGYGAYGQPQQNRSSPGQPAGQGAPGAQHADHEFEPDYLRWREEQMRAHDREYQDWRRDQHRRYDEQYRQFRQERQHHFGRAFHEWRAQRTATGAAPGAGGADQRKDRDDDRG